MTDTKKEKKTRTPRTAESITAGALALPLFERVKLMNALKDSIAKEVNDLEAKTKEAKEIAGV